MKNLIVDSFDRSSSSSSTSDFYVTLDRPIEKGNHLTLVNAIIPNTYYVFNSNNNVITFNEGAGSVTATITAGSYGTGALATEIQTQMNGAGLSTDYTVTFDDTTLKYTITKASSTFELEFTVASSPYYELGFTASDTGLATSQTSANVVSLNGPRYFYLNVDGDFQSKVYTSNYRVFDFIFPNQGVFGDTNDYSEVNFKQKRCVNRQINHMHIQLCDRSGTNINLNGSDMQLVFEFE